MDASSTLAGPSRPRRKPAAPHPSVLKSLTRRKLRPPLPPRSSEPAHPGARGAEQIPVPLRPLQGLKVRRTDTTRPVYGREEIFVTRKTGLGLLIGRCRSLVMEEGYTRLTFHAITAAIPQALLLLHALLDVLPYPTDAKGMWYEIRTGSVECTDEMEAPALPSAPLAKGQRTEAGGGQASAEAADGVGCLEGIGGMEADEPERRHRTVSSIRIDLHIAPPRSVARAKQHHAGSSATDKKKVDRPNRPSKKRRLVLRRQRTEGVGQSAEPPGEEEEAMNDNSAKARSASGRVSEGTKVTRKQAPARPAIDVDEVDGAVSEPEEKLEL